MIGLIALLLVAFASAQNHTTYIVVFKDAMTVAELNLHLANVLGDVQPTYLYQKVLKGFAAPLSPEALLAATQHEHFDFYEEDQIVHAVKVDQRDQCLEAPTASWGLARICERRRVNANSRYFYPEDSGKSINAYIIDTGIYVANNDFGGRAVFGFKAQSSWSNTDGNGHGTHVASTVGGKNYGVAKLASLIAVKVLGDDGSGTNAGVIAGVEWAATDNAKSTKRGVANLSLGGGKSVALNNACDAAMSGGLFMVVAAGNDNRDACLYSPASAPLVVTVGATTLNVQGADQRSSFSNWGPCVDIFAPGSDITAAWIGSPSATRTISGTSMASPHVCGVGALVIDANPKFSTAEAKHHLNAHGTHNVINLACTGACGDTKNIMVWNGCSDD